MHTRSARHTRMMYVYLCEAFASLRIDVEVLIVFGGEEDRLVLLVRIDAGLLDGMGMKQEIHLFKMIVSIANNFQ